MITMQKDTQIFTLCTVDSGNENTYWKYSSGAFGQYYFGAMRALAIVSEFENEKGDSIFKVTEYNEKQEVSGQQLADAFNLTLTTDIINLFYDTIKQGKLFKDKISQLYRYFAMDKIDINTDEWYLYKKMHNLNKLCGQLQNGELRNVNDLISYAINDETEKETYCGFCDKKLKLGYDYCYVHSYDTKEIVSR